MHSLVKAVGCRTTERNLDDWRRCRIGNRRLRSGPQTPGPPQPRRASPPTCSPSTAMDVSDLHPPDDKSHRLFIWHEWIQVCCAHSRCMTALTACLGKRTAHAHDGLRLFRELYVLRQAVQQLCAAHADDAHRVATAKRGRGAQVSTGTRAWWPAVLTWSLSQAIYWDRICCRPLTASHFLHYSQTRASLSG